MVRKNLQEKVTSKKILKADEGMNLALSERWEFQAKGTASTKAQTEASASAAEWARIVDLVREVKRADCTRPCRPQVRLWLLTWMRQSYGRVLSRGRIWPDAGAQRVPLAACVEQIVAGGVGAGKSLSRLPPVVQCDPDYSGDTSR